MNVLNTAAPADTLWEDARWEQLLALIEKNRVIPVIGPALSAVEVGGRQLTMDRYVAERLLGELGVPREQMPEQLSLNDAVSRYTRERGKDNLIYAKIYNIVRKTNFAPPKALIQLAEIAQFRLLVTTASDSLLADAIDQVRFSGQRRTQRLRYLPNEVHDSDLKIGLRKLTMPTVYHLLGFASPLPDEFVICDEDMLEFIYALQSESQRPVNLLDELRDNHLLILGENFADWLARFFLRTAKRQRLSNWREPIEILADERSHAEPTLVSFLASYSPQTKVFRGNASAFIEELWTRCSERFGLFRHSDDRGRPPQGSKRLIFISYANEDIEVVETLKKGIEGAGFRVWFDSERLKPGSKYDPAIEDNIKAAKHFIAVLSRNTQTVDPGEPRYFRREWDLAKQHATMLGENYRYIIPVNIDADSTKKGKDLEGPFPGRTVLKVPGGKVTSDVIEALISPDPL